MDSRLSVRITQETMSKLAEKARKERKSESLIVREALEAHLSTTESVYDQLVRIGGLGIAKGLPNDLSRNKAYMEGFGQHDPPRSVGHRPARRSSRK
jgi:predicted transcriptional regulator